MTHKSEVSFEMSSCSTETFAFDIVVSSAMTFKYISIQLLSVNLKKINI